MFKKWLEEKMQDFGSGMRASNWTKQFSSVGGIIVNIMPSSCEIYGCEIYD